MWVRRRTAVSLTTASITGKQNSGQRSAVSSQLEKWPR
jgi:hypothetical protein